MPSWDEAKHLFGWDGSLNDLYVVDTDVDDWQKLLDHLRVAERNMRFTVGGEETPLPQQVSAIFALQDVVGTELIIDRNGLSLNCHFFWSGEIEFDIDPREVNSKDRFYQLVAFMRSVADALGKEVVMTPETSDVDREAVLLQYPPSGDTKLHHSVSKGAL